MGYNLYVKELISNRTGKRLCVVVETGSHTGRLAFVMHGLGGYKEQAHIRAMVEAFLETGYTVVSFDTTNTFGESEGNYEDATVTNYYADLEDVIAWARGQSWFSDPFVLCGHSLGGICTALYAERHPGDVQALAPISSVISGKLSLETDAYTKDVINDWKESGWLVSKSHDGKRTKRLKWSHMEDRLKYDLLPGANKLTMPVLMVVGENDDSTPAVHQKILFNMLPGKKELHIIKGAPHTFYEPDELRELKQIFTKWLNSLE